MSKHPRQFSPRQVLLVLCDKREQEHRVDGRSKLKLETGAKIRLQKFLPKPGYYFFFLLSMLIFAFLTALLQHRSPLSHPSSPGKGGTNFQLKNNAVRDTLGSNPQSFLLFSYSSGPLKICSGAIKACQLEADATSI